MTRSLAKPRARRYSEQPRLLGEWLRAGKDRTATIRVVGDRFHVTMKRKIGDATGEASTIGEAIFRASESAAQFIEYEVTAPMGGILVTGLGRA